MGRWRTLGDKPETEPEKTRTSERLRLKRKTRITSNSSTNDHKDTSGSESKAVKAADVHDGRTIANEELSMCAEPGQAAVTESSERSRASANRAAEPSPGSPHTRSVGECGTEYEKTRTFERLRLKCEATQKA